jgi:hypothetical protein
MAASQAYQPSPDVLTECPATLRAGASVPPGPFELPRPAPAARHTGVLLSGVKSALEPQAAELSAAC